MKQFEVKKLPDSNLNNGMFKASTHEDGRLRTVHPSMWTTDQNLGSDRPPRGRIRWLDQDNNFRVDERTVIICPRWTEVDESPSVEA